MKVLAQNQAEMQKLPSFLREFSAYKIAVEGLSDMTVSEYLLDLRTFFRFTEATRLGIPYVSEDFCKIDISQLNIDYVKDIDPLTINEFLLYAKQNRNNDWSARTRKLSSLKAFFKYCKTKKSYIEKNPVEDFTSVKKHTTLPKYLSLEESISLLEAVRNDGDSKTVLRDYAIVTMFLNCGMRLSELVGINLNDFNKEMTCVRVVGKGHKERIIYLNDACRSALYDYLKERVDIKPEEIGTTALFLSLRKQRISNKTVQWMIYKYLKLAGLEYKHFSVHKLRHTAATLMYQSGKVDVRVLKDILGHAQLNTTQIYTHLSDDSMSRAMEDNPLSHVKIEKKKQ